MTSSDRYTVDHDWLWGRKNLDRSVATLRLLVSHETPRLAEAAIGEFLDGLSADVNGVRGSGGWAVYPVGGEPHALDLVSGGEDVADGIQDAADAAFESLSRWKGLRLSWRQLPILLERWT